VSGDTALGDPDVVALIEALDRRLVAVEGYIASHALDRCGEAHRAAARRHDAHERDFKAIADDLVPILRQLWSKTFGARPMPAIEPRLVVRPGGELAP